MGQHSACSQKWQSFWDTRLAKNGHSWVVAGTKEAGLSHISVTKWLLWVWGKCIFIKVTDCFKDASIFVNIANIAYISINPRNMFKGPRIQNITIKFTAFIYLFIYFVFSLGLPVSKTIVPETVPGFSRDVGCCWPRCVANTDIWGPSTHTSILLWQSIL